MVSRAILHQIAKESYDKTPKNEVGSFGLIFDTPTLKFYKDGDTIVVGIRGTEPSDTRDIKADASIVIGNLGNSERYKRDLKTLKEIQQNLPKSKYRYI